MSNETHTPGPWSAFSDGNHTNIVAVLPHTACVFSLPGHHKNDPDVRLISAAPDLLYALEMATQWIEHFQSNGNAAQTLRDARAAIAKATGSAT